MHASNLICYCGTSREGSLLRFYLKHVAGYPNVRLYEGAWKEYVWLKDKSLPAETGGEPAGNKVIVSSKEVPTPVAVRYAWAMNPSQRNLLYNKEGLPASPFRTDNWPLFDPNDPAVRVEKPEKTDEARDAKRNFKDWERPKMTQ